MNPLLADDEWPPLAAIAPEHVAPAMAALLKDADAALDAAQTAPASYAALSAQLDPAVERLNRAWGLVEHLRSVVDTPAWREAFTASQPGVVAFNTRLGADARLFERWRAVAEHDDALDAVQRKVVADRLRDFELGGAGLVGPARGRFIELQARAAECSRRFGENLLDATDAWSLVVDASRLAGMPDDVVAQARALAAADGMAGCKLTLQEPCRLAVLRHAEDRALRATVYAAHAGLCSDDGPPQWRNHALIEELVALRAESAALVGHASHADRTLVARMAGSVGAAERFLLDLAARARPAAEAEACLLESFARDAFGLDALAPWDREFVAERVRRARFDIDEAALRRYFPLPRVRAGLFELVERLFGVQVRTVDSPAWHPDAEVHEFSRDGVAIGHLCMDLHARPGKQSGAWMHEARSRWRRPDGRLQRPIAFVACNFAPARAGQPALLSHDDVVTLLHETGHALHHLLTEVDELAASGIAGVEWDACELPSQLMENFAWEPQALALLSGTIDGGTPLPAALVERLRASRQFGSATRLLRDVDRSLFDLRLHASGPGPGGVRALAACVHQEIAVRPDPSWSNHPYRFSHLFDGGYAAGYYGYAWAEVLAADAFDAFADAGSGPVSPDAVGERWRREVLATGSGRTAIENFVAFRGRPPQPEAYFRQHGLLEPQARVG